MRPIPAHLRVARDTRGAAQGWLCGGLLALIGHDVLRLAAAAGFAPAPVSSFLAQ